MEITTNNSKPEDIGGHYSEKVNSNSNGRYNISDACMLWYTKLEDINDNDKTVSKMIYRAILVIKIWIIAIQS